jgi:outer membrane protein assembly factor BamB
VVNDIVYAADTTGSVYAVNRDGTLKWKTVLAIPALGAAKLVTTPLVTNRTVILGDMTGFIHGLDVETGAPKWRVSPNPHPFAAIFGHGTMVGRYVAFGTSSFELFAPLVDPTYTNFTFRGSVVLLDPSDGEIVWQTFTVTDAEHAAGASGATVWGAPAYDRASNTLFVGTSNNYSLPTTGTSDALIALDARDGRIKWVSQKTGGDHWNYSFLPEDPDDPPDFDFGDSPQLYRLHGRLVVAAGQKSGFFHVVDARTGAEVTAPRQYLPGGHLGGFHIESGYADDVNYAPGNFWHDPFSGNPPDGGALVAIRANGAAELWRFDPGAPIISGVAIANRVVYAQAVNGTFYALDARSGAELTRLNVGGQTSGPAISRGRIYLGAGDALSPALFNPFAPPGPGAIVALGLPDRHGHGHPARPLKGHGSGRFVDAAGGFVAEGAATHPGAFTHHGTLLLAPTDDPEIFAISDTTVYLAANGDRLSADLTGTLNVRTGFTRGTDARVGGPGRFADVRGTADVTAQLLPDGTFTFSVTGEIDF